MTEEERYDKLDAKLDRILAKLEDKLEGVDSKLQNHEVRIVVLETTKEPESSKRDWKTDVITLLAKSIVIGGVAIAGLAGAGGILAKIFGA